MASTLKSRKLSKKELFDITTMMYFIPLHGAHRPRITLNDKRKMANLSSHGEKPDYATKGFKALQWGKTYRDEQITAYRRDIPLGYITKHEIISSYPKNMQKWIQEKLRDIPYDINQSTSKMLTRTYSNGN